MFWKSAKIRYTKSQRIGISVLVFLLVLVESGVWWLNNRKSSASSYISVPDEILALQNQVDASESARDFSPFHSLPGQIQDFDPNQLYESDWQNLGFSPKQVAAIFKYKNSLGGRFTSKQQIKECFVISDKKFRQLEPHILLPEFTDENSTSPDNSTHLRKSKERIHYRKFDPNDYTKQEWMKIGFSGKQAEAILKYKRSLGGKFTSLEQIQQSYVISVEKFAEMKPYIHFNSEEIPAEEEPAKLSKEIPSHEKFNPNELTREQWMDLGFTEKQVNTLFNYKNSLGGKFKDAATLKKCYSISEQKFAEIEPYLIFD